MKKLISIFLICMISIFTSFSQPQIEEYDPPTNKIDSLELKVNVKFNTPAFVLQKQKMEETHFKEYLGKSTKNDSLFLEEIKKVSNDLIPLLQNLKYPNLEILEKYGFTKEIIYQSIVKDNRIKIISKLVAISAVIFFLFLEALNFNKFNHAAIITNRAKLEFFALNIIIGLSVYFIIVFLASLINNPNLALIKEILKYS